MQTRCKTLAAALLLGCAAFSRGANPWPSFTWRVPEEAPFTARAQFRRGDTVNLRPLWAGADTNGWAYTLHWQAEGMGDAWWTDSADPFRWTPARDCGADSYALFIRAAYPGGTNDRAAAAVRMLPSPGAAPNALPLPRQWIDFAAVDVTNAPWADAAAVAAAIAAATNALPPAAADLSAATNYTDAAVAALSNHVEAAIAAIPSGGAAPQGWVTQSPPVAWTNAPVAVTVPGGGSLTFTGDWPDAAPVYLRVTASGAYTVPQESVRLLGYAAWPPAGSTFQCAVWFDGSRYLVNLLLAEGQE